MKILMLALCFVVTSLGAEISYACSPEPPENTNWLNFRIEFDQKTIPKGTVLKASGWMVVVDGDSGDKPLIKMRDQTSAETALVPLPKAVHFTDLTQAALDPGSLPTFDQIRPRKEVPSKKRFEFTISVNDKPHKIAGAIVYSRNPKYNPHALEQWKDPCRDL